MVWYDVTQWCVNLINNIWGKIKFANVKNLQIECDCHQLDYSGFLWS